MDSCRDVLWLRSVWVPQEYKGKRLVAVDSPGEDVEEEAADEEDTKATEENGGKPKLVGEQQTELASFVKVSLYTHMPDGMH